MSRPFAKYPAKPTFAQINEALDASEYIANKKAKYSFCKPNICYPNKNVYSQSNYLIQKQANNLKFNYYGNNIDNTQLYINLLTELDISSNIPVISDSSGNTYPAIINPCSVVPYLAYNIDPSGVLFGESPCGLYNFENFVVYNTQSNT